MLPPETSSDASAPFLVRPLGALPRQPLTEGSGSLRDIWADAAPGENLQWLLRLVEVRGTGAKLHAPHGTVQLVVGLSGPQVTVGTRGGSPLRREKAVAQDTTIVEFRRPLVRVAGASRLLSLAYRAGDVVPRYTFESIDGESEIDADVRVLIVLQGELGYAGRMIGAQSALVLPRAATEPARAERARVLALRIAEGGA